MGRSRKLAAGDGLGKPGDGAAMRRTQIYLSARETAVLDERAASTGQTRSQLIRAAITAHYLRTPDREQALRLLGRSSGAWTGRRDDGAATVEKLRHGRLAGLHGAGRRRQP